MNRYGNDGYTTFYRFMEQLAASEYHCLNLNDELVIEYVSGMCLIDRKKFEEIVSLLVRLGLFDKELWIQHKVIFSEYFIELVADAYRKR